MLKFGVYFFLLLMCSGNLYAQDWNQWRGPFRNGITNEKIHWPENGLKILWTAELGKTGSNVSVADGLLYTHTFEPKSEMHLDTIDGVDTYYFDGIDILQCLDALTGELIWKKEFPGQGGWNGYVGPAPVSTPTVDNGKVYFWSRMAVMRCMDAKTGALIWNRDLYNEKNLQRSWTGFEGSPIIFREKVIINSNSPVGMALNKFTGEIMWESGSAAPSHSSHVLFEYEEDTLGLLYAGSSLNVFDPDDGKQITSYSWPTKHWHNSCDPIVAGNKVFISSGYDMGAALLEFTGSDLKPVWHYKDKEGFTEHSSMVYKDGFLYGVGTCIRLEDGENQWPDDRPLKEGGLIIADDQLVIMDNRGNLMLASAKPDSLQILNQEKIISGPVWTSPVLSNELLFVKNTNGKLICFDVGERKN